MAVFALAASVRAEPPPDTRERRDYVYPAERAWHTAIAVGPGAVVHGAGHASVGDPETADRLLAAEGAGFGAMLGGLAGLALTGASRYTIVPFSLITIAGAGLVTTSWLADVYGTALREDERGRPPTLASTFESELGYRYVYDPQFRYRNFFVERIDGRLWRLHLQASVWSALDDDNARLGVLAGVRLWGATPGHPAADGSWAEVETAFYRYRYGSDGFEARSGELSASTRLDLARWEPRLAGSFVEAGTGVGLRETRYLIPGLSVPPDRDTFLLARFAFGFYFGDPDHRGGETSFYYDHRHDDYAAGLKLTGLGSGVAGHLGTSTRLWLGDAAGILVNAEVGSAYVAGISALLRSNEL
jgi:hypothetical protein